MVKADMIKGEVEIEGMESVILTEVTMIIKSLVKNGIDYANIEETYRVAVMSDEDLKKETLNKLQKMIKKITKEIDDQEGEE